mgnify:CR=1 FL=1
MRTDHSPYGPMEVTGWPTIVIARGARYLALGVLAIYYGDAALELMRTHGRTVALVLVALILAAAVAWWLLQRRPSAPSSCCCAASRGGSVHARVVGSRLIC